MLRKHQVADIQLRSKVVDVVQVSPMAIVVMDLNGDQLAASPTWSRLFALSENQVALKSGESHRQLTLQRCLQGETVREAPLSLVDEAGRSLWIQVEVGPCLDANGQAGCILAHAHDITEEVEARRSSVEAREQLTAALGVDRMSVVSIDIKSGAITAVCVSEELSYMLEDAGPEMMHIFQDDRPAIAAASAAWLAANSGDLLRVEFRLARHPKTWVYAVFERHLDVEGNLDRMIIVFQDITAKKKAQEDIERLAFTDALTGLPNRAKFQLEFEKATAAASASGRPLGMIMVDVDHFKDINDTLGHDAGDALLIALGQHLRTAFRSGDLVARLGGDEFAILLPDVATEVDLVRPLSQVRRVLERPIEYKGQGIKIHTSIGAALHSDADADPAHVMKNADIALYKAKQQGRNQVVVFEPSMRSDVEQKLELLRDVRLAIPRGEFTLFYQPVVSVGEGRVSGFEALMRWNHPEQGVLLPAAFMAALEDHDLSLQLGEVTIETVLKQIKAWMDAGVEFGKVAVNLSSAQFRTGRLAGSLQARLRYWGVPAERLAVEVTENVYLGWGAEIVSETIRNLHDQGITIALDDFGTGYASLANLRQFPIDRLKIDKSFVQNLDDDAIVRAVINLGASMGLEVVAEGVETSDQLDAVSRYGCDQVQGFHFAKAMPAVDVPGYLKTFSELIAVKSAA